MPIFTFRDADTGNIIDVRSPTEPTEQDIAEFFSIAVQREQGLSEFSPEQKALELGAVPGIAVTPEQQEQIALNQPIQPEQPTLTGDQFQPAQQTGFQEPLIRSGQQGLQNIGSGILRGIGEIRNLVGDEEANKFLEDLAVSTTMEQEKTRRVTEGSPKTQFVGEVIGETVGFGAGGAGKSLITRLLTSGASGGASGGLSAAGRGEEASDIQKEATIGALFGSVGEGVSEAAGKAINLFRESRRLKKQKEVAGFESDTSAFASAARELEKGQKVAEKTGIRLLPAQKTLDPFQREQTAFLGQNPEISRRALDVLKTQNEEAAVSVANLLNDIALPESVGTAGSRGKGAATNVIDAKVLIRKQKSSPVYENAFDIAQRSGLVVDIDPVISSINKKLEVFTEEGEVAKILKKAKKLIGGPAVDAAPGKTVPEQLKRAKRPTLRRMHNTKMEIDELIQQRKDKGTLGSIAERELVDIQNQFLKQMDDLNVGYSKARKEFAKQSPAIDELRNGVIGKLSRLKDAGLKEASGILFDAAETNPKVMTNAIKSLKGVDGGAEIARGLLRTELEKRLGKLPAGLKEGDTAAIANVPARLNTAIFGNDSQRKVLFAALKELSPKAVDNAEWLQEGLKRAAVARPGGSQTGIRQVITQRLRGVSLALRQFIKTPLDSLVGVGEEAAINAKVKSIGDALYSPDWAPDMDKIRELSPVSPKAATKFEKLLNRIVDINQKTGFSAKGARTATTQEEDKQQ